MSSDFYSASTKLDYVISSTDMKFMDRMVQYLVLIQAENILTMQVALE